jgi:hypothetical protein
MHVRAFKIHPQEFAYRFFAQSDAERDRLAASQPLEATLQGLPVSHNYPSKGRSGVHIDFES